jgi:hypothetical protein
MNGVAALANDVEYLTEFVESLENAEILKGNLAELQQTVALMQTENSDEFFDISIRNKKFGRVDAMNGPRILEKSRSSQPLRHGALANYFPGLLTLSRARSEMKDSRIFLPALGCDSGRQPRPVCNMHWGKWG